MGKTSILSSWATDIIYFILVDRFHDGKERSSKTPINGKGFGSGQVLKESLGGNLKGITAKLSYIKGLGCSAIWITPVWENNPESYHGYSIQNFYKIDPRFGSEEDLVELIARAHSLEMKVYLDVVINHSGENWYYQQETLPKYSKGRTYSFGRWRSPDLPQPIELRNPDYYFKKGMIQNWDTYPETRHGDFFSLKKFKLDESREGVEVLKVLTEVYKYWLDKTDCDGFRIDAAKHAGENAVNRFCTEIKKYAIKAGKKDFFLFAEVPSSDPHAFSFFKPITTKERIDHGPDSLLDFPLHFLLRKLVLGKVSPALLRRRYDHIEKAFSMLGKDQVPLVSFLDNHDQIESSYKKRIASGLSDEQLIAALGILFTLPGIPCLYYGTEQGLKGEGEGDHCIREAMFDFKNPEGADLFDSANPVYQAISKLASIRREYITLSRGKLFWPAFKSSHSGEPLVFGREYDGDQFLICYNPDNEKLNLHVNLNNLKASPYHYQSVIFSNKGEVRTRVESSIEGEKILVIVLSPEEFIILK